MAEGSTRNAALGGCLGGCLVGVLIGGGLVGLWFMRPAPDPTADCRDAITAIAADMGETVSPSDMAESIAECMQEVATDPEAAALIDCLNGAPDAEGREACMNTGPRGHRAKRAEAPANVDGIRTAEKAYHAEWDAFTSAGWTPATIGGETAIPFAGGDYRRFELLGWVADGTVRCRYRTTASNADRMAADDFLIEAECDVDGDGINAIYHANRASKAWMVTPADVY